MNPNLLRRAAFLIAALALVLIRGSSISATPAHTSPTGNGAFSRLRPGEQIVIRFKSRGCFGGSDCQLVFTADPVPTLAVPRSARVTLTDAQVERLDHLLDFYRQRFVGACTTRDVVGFTFVDDDNGVRSENFFDTTCKTGELADADPADLEFIKSSSKPVLSLDSVCAQAATAKHLGLESVAYRDQRNDRLDNIELRDRSRRVSEPVFQQLQSAFRSISGYELLWEKFWVADAIQSVTRSSLSLTLRPKNPAVFDTISLIIPSADGVAEMTGPEIVALVRAAEARVADKPWFRRVRMDGKHQVALDLVRKDGAVDAVIHVYPDGPAKRFRLRDALQ